MTLQTPVSQVSRSLKMYASRLEKLDIKILEDFLLHLPSRYDDYSLISPINEVQSGETVTIQGQVLDIKTNYLRGARIKTMQKALVADGTGTIELTWFNQPYLTKTILPNSQISASGRANTFGRSKKLSLQSPQFEILYNNANAIHTGRLTAVYPETQGVSSKWLRRQIHSILKEFGENLPDYLPENIKQLYKLMDYQQAIKQIHFPQNSEQAEKAKFRLAFDELFFMQLGSIKKREAWRAKQQGIPFSIKKYQEQLESCKNSLPFTLTNAQQQALDAIYHDLTQPTPMNRLLQGDVGSGKTIVAALSMYAAYLNGYQSTLMAPTEILATQHYLSIKKTLEPLGVQVELITGNKKLNSKKRESTTLSNSVIPAKAGISKDSQSNSKITFDILIGTHAILSEKVKFENLGLVVIDEQQRFGVEQRGIIKKKGKNPHFLTMTATPIPRTVALTMYGDLDLSYLDEMPQGRKRIKTWLVPQEKRQGAYDWIRKQIKETDCQVFLVCPFIEPSETMQTVKAVKDEYEKLKNEIFPDLKLGLLHGKQPAKEKEKTLHDFKNGKFSLLVATPVVEVGIDIPNATIIVIEASERFGLAQLHQLRGRVGRNDKQSYCLLFTESTNPQTTQRLKAMETMFSGAALAELDLKLRGAGNIFGTQQHGIPHLKAATFSDTSLIQKAKHAATLLYPELNQYPELLKKLESTENSNITPD